MKFKKTKIDGLYIIEPEIKEDERGYFTRLFCQEELLQLGLDFDIVQINKSYSKEVGVIRGMHFQTKPKAEDKIVQCLKGSIFDVAIDLREYSSTYGQWESIELSEDNLKMFLIPKGCAHGFQTLEKDCKIQYFMSEYYSPTHASGVRYNDPYFNIKWPLDNPILSEKDKIWPLYINL